MENIILELFKMYVKWLDANYMRHLKEEGKLHTFKYK